MAVDERTRTRDDAIVARDRRSRSIVPWILGLLAVIAIVVLAFFLLGGDADVDTEGGDVDVEAPAVDADVEAPDVDVDPGDAPDVDIDPGQAPDVDIDEGDAEADANAGS